MRLQRLNLVAFLAWNIVIVLLVACNLSAQSEQEAIRAKARAIHERIVTIDAHVDIPFDFATPAVDPGKRGSRQIDFPKMIEGGLDAAFFNVYVAQEERTPEAYAKAKADAHIKFDAIHRMTKTMYADRIELATRADDVERIVRAGKLVAAIGIENGFIIGQDVSLIETYFDLGARYMGLAHAGHNDLADSSTPFARFGDDEVEHGGISELGKRAVAEMNRIGMMIDISHLSKAATLDTLRFSRAPVIASHSGVKAVANVRRNLDDEELQALKANGGVVQAIALAAFVRLDSPEKREAIRALAEDVGARVISGSVGPAALAELSEENRAEYLRRRAHIDAQWPGPGQDYIDHIDYVVEQIGIDHIGIGSDFDGGGGIDGWNDASESFNVTHELVRRGYTEAEIRKIWSGNLLRVWRDVERVAAAIGQ